MPEQEEEVVDKLITKLGERENYWNTTLEELSKKSYCSVKDVIPLQAEAISLYQQLNEQIKNMVYEMAKLMPKIKAYKKQRFEYYAGALAPYPNNATERMRLIEWDVAKLEQRKDVLDGHIEFLRMALKDVDNVNWVVKNKIALYQMTDLE
jgi:hypothetical protein